MYAYPEDSGTYTCKAVNALGEAVTSATLKCYGKYFVFYFFNEFLNYWY